MKNTEEQYINMKVNNLLNNCKNKILELKENIVKSENSIQEINSIIEINKYEISYNERLIKLYEYELNIRRKKLEKIKSKIYVNK